MKPWERYSARSASGPWDKYRAASPGGSPEFRAYVERVLKLEGGYANDPDDRGGETKYGISKSANPDVDIPSLTIEGAKSIYRERYWDAIGADHLPPNMQGIAFDAAVNQGVGWTKKALAEANGDAQKFFELRAQHYANIVAKDDSQKKFARGWEKRLEEWSGPWLKYRSMA